MARPRLGQNRLRVLSALIVLLVFGGPPTARAERPVDRQAWTHTGDLPAFVGLPDHIYVATGPLGEARAFVRLADQAVARVRDGSELVLSEAEDSLLPEAAEIAACVLTEPFEGQGEIDEAPEMDCTARVDARRTEPGEWTVALPLLAARWSEPGSNHGLALVPETGTAGLFRVAFDATATAIRSTPAPPPAPANAPSRTTPGTGATLEDVPPSDSAPTTPIRPAPRSEPAATPSTPRTGTTGDSEPAARAAMAAAPTAGSPAAATVLALAMVAGLAVLVGTVLLRPISLTGLHPHRWGAKPGEAAALLLPTAVALGLVLPLFAPEVVLFKVGLILIVVTAAIGLHILVNWAGELSLAHAAFVGLPAFVAAQLSHEHGISPVLLLPVAVLTGAVLGAVVGAPALRARGLQVALVTLAAGIAVERFFFTKPWLVGTAGGVDVADPAIGPIQLASTRTLYPVLAVAVALAVWAAWALWRSKIGRALLWVRANHSAAAAFGIPVARYRMVAYLVAGAFAGLAGGLFGVWVQRLTPQAFPFTLSFTYLVIVVVAGRGFIAGVVVAAAFLEGGRLFSGASSLIDYGGPIALVLAVTRYKKGINGIGSRTMQIIRESELVRRIGDAAHTGGPPGLMLTPGLLAGIAAIGGGFVAIVLGWYHAGNTDQVWIQNQELLSGGIGGLALVIVGVGLLVRDRIAKSQAELAVRLVQALGNRQPLPEPSTERVDVPTTEGPATNGPRRSRTRRRTGGTVT